MAELLSFLIGAALAMLVIVLLFLVVSIYPFDD